MINRFQHPLKWAIEQIDALNVEVQRLGEEIKRLEAEKAGRKGRKPKE